MIEKITIIEGPRYSTGVPKILWEGTPGKLQAGIDALSKLKAEHDAERESLGSERRAILEACESFIADPTQPLDGVCYIIGKEIIRAHQRYSTE